MLTLGIPGSASMALMLGAMIMHGITPGPQVMTSRPDLFWGLIASMWIGNGMLLLLNLPLIGIWVRLLQVPYRLLFPIIMTMMGIGIYSLNNTGTDVLLMAFFGFVGYVLAKLGCSFPPLILAMVLGPLLEENLRRSMLLSEGDPSVFFTRPISGGVHGGDGGAVAGVYAAGVAEEAVDRAPPADCPPRTGIEAVAHCAYAQATFVPMLTLAIIF